METGNEFRIDWGCCVAGDSDDRDPVGASESQRLYDAGLLLRILCVIFGCLLLALSILIGLLGDRFVHVFLQ